MCDKQASWSWITSVKLRTFVLQVFYSWRGSRWSTVLPRSSSL